ncbi:hypothetical protein [Bacterioplanoides sp.]|uniref:hypothetical protein n=1 Tax=Bacterioplanoides sp. TaxID=2066072 RepID=UPI003B5B9F7A
MDKKFVLLTLMTTLAMQGCMSDSSTRQEKSKISKESYQSTTQNIDLGNLSINELPEFEFQQATPTVFQNLDADLSSTAAPLRESSITIPEEKQEETISALAYNPSYVQISGCVRIQHNTAYNYKPASGNSACLYIDINDDAITEFFAIDQNPNRQVTITAIDDPNGNHSLVGIKKSQETDSDDNIRIYTEKGHYYMLVSGVSGDGGNVRVGVAVKTKGVDDLENIGSTPSYDGNNSTPYTLPNGTLKDYYPTLHSPQDIDLYKLQSFWGQDLFVRVTPQPGHAPQFIAEALLNNKWTNLSIGGHNNFTNIPQFGELIIRVRAANPNQPLTTGIYVLEAGSRVMQIKDETPDGDRAARVTSGSDYARVQNKEKFKWQTKIMDSTGNPVRGVKTWLRTTTEAYTTVSLNQETTDYFGVAKGTYNLIPCTGKNAFPHQQASPHIRYDTGEYWFEVAPAHFNTPPVVATNKQNWLNLCTEYQSYPPNN